MHRVELKETVRLWLASIEQQFLMHRVELKVSWK